ncbi:U2AF35A, partial [Symbiodinium sp. CCMP2592]
MAMMWVTVMMVVWLCGADTFGKMMMVFVCCDAFATDVVVVDQDDHGVNAEADMVLMVIEVMFWMCLQIATMGVNCIDEANLGQNVCVWEGVLPGGRRFSSLVAQALALQLQGIGFVSIEWWGGKDFKDTGG